MPHPDHQLPKRTLDQLLQDIVHRHVTRGAYEQLGLGVAHHELHNEGCDRGRLARPGGTVDQRQARRLQREADGFLLAGVEASSFR